MGSRPLPDKVNELPSVHPERRSPAWAVRMKTGIRRFQSFPSVLPSWQLENKCILRKSLPQRERTETVETHNKETKMVEEIRNLITEQKVLTDRTKPVEWGHLGGIKR